MKYTHVSNVSVGYVPTEYTLWWTWRESNPRPECLALRLVQQFFNYLPRARLVARRAAWRTGEPLR